MAFVQEESEVEFLNWSKAASDKGIRVAGA